VSKDLPLVHGAAIPRIGLGTWPMSDREAERAVATAIGLGYRLIDTAENYGNERGVGRGVRASGLAREEVYITSKFNRRWHGVDLVQEAFERSAERLGVEYLDLLLIHWPNPRQDRYVQAWQGLARLLEQGRLRAIGVSNFKISHLQRLLDETGVVPDVNQIELNPYVARKAVTQFDAQHGIVTESWSPIGGGGTRVLRDPVITRIAAELGRTPAQIVLRWHVQSGFVAIPKSSDPERMRQNLDVFGFSLPDKEMEAINGLDRGESAAADSDSFGH
jgi:2,5-diketo-D-gluconate reductase A